MYFNATLFICPLRTRYLSSSTINTIIHIKLSKSNYPKPFPLLQLNELLKRSNGQKISSLWKLDYLPVTWVILLAPFPHRSTSLCPSVQHETFLTGIHWNWGGMQYRCICKKVEGRGIWEMLETCFSVLAYLPEIGNFNSPMVHEAFTITSKNVDSEITQ